MMRTVFLPLLLGGSLFAGGYKIPENSLNSVALSAATVASSNGADAAYYNPANMVFMKNGDVLEANLLYIGLSDIEYTSATTSLHSKRENFIVPSLHYVSHGINDFRFGLSIVSPAGLSKRWEDAPAVYTAKEFTLKTVEVNPTVALSLGERAAFAVGVRAIYSDGVVKSNAPIASRDMSGDSVDFGYNFALSYKPTSESALALTYRSKVDLSLKGDADLTYLTNSSASGASVSVPVPALLNLALSYTLPSDTTVEFVYERNYWHAYKELDFNYGSGVNPVTNMVFGAAIAKEWRDTDVFRFGITQKLDKLTLMGGMVIDETPVPNGTLGYELPDSDSLSLSLGMRYFISDKLNIGLAALYSMREDRAVSNTSINGEFKDASVLIVASSLEYRF